MMDKSSYRLHFLDYMINSLTSIVIQHFLSILETESRYKPNSFKYV